MSKGWEFNGMVDTSIRNLAKDKEERRDVAYELLERVLEVAKSEENLYLKIEVYSMNN